MIIKKTLFKDGDFSSNLTSLRQWPIWRWASETWSSGGVPGSKWLKIKWGPLGEISP